MSKKQSSSNKSLPSTPSAGPKLPAPKSTGPKLPAPQSTGPKLPKTVPTIVKPGGRGNPMTAAKTPEQIRNEARGKMFAGTVSKETKKKKKKIIKDETNTATLPIIDLNIDPTGGYIPYTPSIPTSVKVPDRDAVIALQRDGADQALITSVLFEQIGATELVKFVKNDTVDGLNPQYNVISNVADLKTKLDTSYLIAKQRPDVTIDNGFSIRLQDKLPSIDYLFDNNIPNYIHFDSTIGQYGSLVIELDNIDIDEIVEVEIDTNGTIVEVR